MEKEYEYYYDEDDEDDVCYGDYDSVGIELEESNDWK